MYGRRVVFHLRELQPAWVDLVSSIPGTGSVEAVDNKLVVSLKDPDEIIPEIFRTLVAAGADVQFVGEIQHSLKQVHLEMVKGGEKGQQ